ncbi:hypothetical protein JCGZ_02036 [Jatropha curcas]|uniref:Uncharacterized protein n=1 Tax=Jatropha curcas TaxID=180498 RepID=A0A067KYH1_JATCU|nr:uncharacterized protein LOC105631843 [Jatropha curcas]KDP40038.1 hypothetical protein JCGZ_02036 [Jatropha curcas]
MMDKKNELVDLSSFLLVEGSADSEGLLKLCEDVNMDCDYGEEEEEEDDDDAESCSCDTTTLLEVCCCSEFDEADKDCSDGQEPSSCRWMLEFTCDKEGEEEVSKSVSKEVMDQMEDTLFWETCLAVGYPTQPSYP